MALCCEVVDLIRLNVLEYSPDRAGIRQITIMQPYSGILRMRIAVHVINAIRIEQTGTTNYAMNIVQFTGE